jgi:hypothetical protein
MKPGQMLSFVSDDVPASTAWHWSLRRVRRRWTCAIRDVIERDPEVAERAFAR